MVKNIISNFFLKCLRKLGRDLITLFTKIKRDRILFVQESASGSNSYALWKAANAAMREKYDLVLYEMPQREDVFIFVKKHRLISSARIIVTTHSSFKPSRKHIHIQLWHGVPLKKIGSMEIGRTAKFKPSKLWRQVDYIMSYSETYTTFLNACMLSDPDKYVITGAPRNDWLFASEGRADIQKIVGGADQDVKYIFYIPTFREGYLGLKQGDKTYGNPFGFEIFDPERFDKFLSDNKCVMIFKPHPHEEQLMQSYFSEYPLKNMVLLTDIDLKTNKLDFYEVLNSCDILITDYSSVFYDFLLLNRPVIFTPVDLDAYKATRGIMIESFESWVPGPVALDQDALEVEIGKCLYQEDYYREKRNNMSANHHRYQDGNSSARLWTFMDNLLSE
jgi:CDP-glycerol glycerophosphotransferase (TagB/SpsB family)